jgi:hypothetical protein
LLPVYVRLRHGGASANLQQQLWDALAAQCEANDVAYGPPPGANAQAEITTNG